MKLNRNIPGVRLPQTVRNRHWRDRLTALGLGRYSSFGRLLGLAGAGGTHPLSWLNFLWASSFPWLETPLFHHYCSPIVSIFCTWAHCDPIGASLCLLLSIRPRIFFLNIFLFKFQRKKRGLTQFFCVCSRLWNELLTSLLTGCLLVFPPTPAPSTGWTNQL